MRRDTLCGTSPSCAIQFGMKFRLGPPITVDTLLPGMPISRSGDMLQMTISIHVVQSSISPIQFFEFHVV
jgi:hypothetical protein